VLGALPVAIRRDSTPGKWLKVVLDTPNSIESVNEIAAADWLARFFADRFCENVKMKEQTPNRPLTRGSEQQPTEICRVMGTKLEAGPEGIERNP